MRLNADIFNELIKPGERLPWLSDWLLQEVWTSASWHVNSPEEYLAKNEMKVNEFEQIVASAAPGIYDELIVHSKANPLKDKLKNPETAVVVFDGLSLREMPVLKNLCKKSGLEISEAGTAVSAIPSETIDYVESVLSVGRVAPSQLPKRKELKERNISAYYFESPAQRHRIEDDGKAILLWSAFPDNTYNDSEARFAKHFGNNQVLLEEAWKNTVQQVPLGKNIFVTSDHGYIFFASGCSFLRSSPEEKKLREIFGGDRFKHYDEVPSAHRDVYILPDRKLALIKGRVQTHPPGKGGTRLYKHGGLSLMECLVPWIVIERRNVT